MRFDGITDKQQIVLPILCAVAFVALVIAAVLFLPAGWTSMKNWMWW